MLPKHKHVEMAIQTALLEFREGSAERGRGVMEGVLKNYPKRTDLWSVYLDQEVKLGDVRRARQLFDRATSLELAPKKMKFLFKKYLDFEASHGEPARVEAVKQRAMDYVQRALGVR